MTIRAFLAVEIPEDVRAKIAALSDSLRKGAMFTQASLSWTRPEAMHLTIVFLGDIEEPMVERIDQRLRPACASLPPFDYGIRGVGVFPNEYRPRVIWTGARKADDEFRALHDRVESELAPLGHKPEGRKFTPHLTLARLRGGRDSKAIIDIIKNFSRQYLGDAKATELVLFQSELRPEGSKYTALKRFPFEKALE